MYIERVPNRSSPPAILLRESYREGGKVCKRTLANLSGWPEARIEALRAVLRGETVMGRLEESFQIVRSLPHGHVAAVLGTLRKLGLEALMDARASRKRRLAVAMIVARVIAPCSKLATARGLADETLSSSLAKLLKLGGADEDELYEAMDWLGARQERIEAALAKRHLAEGTLVLYDVTSTYFEGRSCPLARLGYSRDGKRARPQIVFGLLCSAAGCPVAVEVFEGDTADPKTLSAQIEKLNRRFGLFRVVVVGDRGMLTEARIREELRPAGLDWITALRAPAIKRLAAPGGPLQLSLFDQRDLAEIESPDYPGERLIVCKNPLLAEERAGKREALVAATEADLEKIAQAAMREKRPLRGKEKIALKVGRVVDKHKVGKHFRLEIGEDRFSFRRDPETIAGEAATDGLYVIRTSVPREALSSEQTVLAYKRLSAAERAFRRYKTVDLKVRPIHHRLAERVRAHIFLCMLAYYVEWHMRAALAPILFDEDDPSAAASQRPSPVAPAARSPRAQAKARTKRSSEGLPVHSFQTLLADLATLTLNRIQPKLPHTAAFDRLARPTPLQQRALTLLGLPLPV